MGFTGLRRKGTRRSVVFLAVAIALVLLSADHCDATGVGTGTRAGSRAEFAGAAGQLAGKVQQGLAAAKSLMDTIKDLACKLFGKCGKDEGRSQAAADEKLEDMINRRALEEDKASLSDLGGIPGMGGGSGSGLHPYGAEAPPGENNAERDRLAPVVDQGLDKLRGMFAKDEEKRSREAARDALRGRGASEEDAAAAERSANILDAERAALRELDGLEKDALSANGLTDAERRRQQAVDIDEMERAGLRGDTDENGADGGASDRDRALTDADADAEAAAKARAREAADRARAAAEAADKARREALARAAAAKARADAAKDAAARAKAEAERQAALRKAEEEARRAAEARAREAARRAAEARAARLDGFGKDAGRGSAPHVRSKAAGPGGFIAKLPGAENIFGGSGSGNGNGSGSGNGNGNGSGNGNGDNEGAGGAGADGDDAAAKAAAAAAAARAAARAAAEKAAAEKAAAEKAAADAWSRAAGGRGSEPGGPGDASAYQGGFNSPRCFFCHQLVHSAPYFAQRSAWCASQDDPALCSSVISAVAGSFQTYAANPATAAATGGATAAHFIAHADSVCAGLCAKP